MFLALPVLFSFPQARAEVFSPLMQRPNPAGISGSDNVLAWSFRQGAFLGNRMLPLDPFFHRWEGAVHIEEKNLVHSRALVEMVAMKGPWEFSLGVREEMSIIGNRDGAEVVRLLKRKQDLPTGNVYGIDLRTSGFMGEELRVARKWDLDGVPGLSAGGALGLIHGERIQEGTIRGTLTVTGRRAYDYALALDYAYDVNYLYSVPLDPRSVEGYGFSFDLGLRYRKGAWDLSLRAEDLLTRIYWEKVNVTKAIANNGRRWFDSDGFVHYDPIITGTEGKAGITQRIAPKVSGEVTHSWDRVSLTAAADWMRDTFFPRAALGLRPFTSGGWWKVAYDVRFRMAGIQYAWEKGELAVFTDAVEPRKIGAAGLQVSLRW